MKAAYIEQTGPPENIIFGDLATPKPAARQVLVKTAAVAVNPVDTYIRNGANYWELPKPFIIGCDLAGVVESVGPEAKRFKPGDRVWCTNQGLMGRQGSFAEYCAVDDASATLFYGDEALGVVSLPVEPETDAMRTVFELTAPRGGLYPIGGKWQVENQGVAPDHEVEITPEDFAAGRDPQLEKGVELLLAALEKGRSEGPVRPPFPDYQQRPWRSEARP